VHTPLRLIDRQAEYLAAGGHQVWAGSPVMAVWQFRLDGHLRP
jgi:hypothetical protein